MLSSDMTVKQQIHHLVDEDVRDGRTYGAEDFMAKVKQRWPRKSSE